MIDVKLLQKDKYCMTNRKTHKNNPYSALFKSSRRYQSIVSFGLILLVFNFSDIKLSILISPYVHYPSLYPSLYLSIYPYIRLSVRLAIHPANKPSNLLFAKLK